MLRKHLVIVGGGWAGLKLARELRHENPKKIRITLISDDSNFRFSPGLYRVATGAREREAIIPINEVLEAIPNITFVKDAVLKIDRDKKTIKTKGGAVFHYDYAVLALGMVTTYFNIPGIAENSYSIKTAAELRKLKSHLHQELINFNAPDKNYVVVGAGPTGVELAAAMTSYMKRIVRWHGIKRRRINIEIVEAAPKVLPVLKPKVSKLVRKRLRKLGVKLDLNAKVEAESNSTLQVSGKSLPTKTVIWTAGMANNPFYKENEKQFTFNERGKIIVDDHLCVDEHTYVIGDNAATPFSGLAYTATHNAKFVANDIRKKLSGVSATKKYKPSSPPAVIPVGSRWAILQYRSIIISGFVGSIFRVLGDFVAYMDLLGFWAGFRIWIKSYEEEEQCQVCKTSLQQQTIISELTN